MFASRLRHLTLACATVAFMFAGFMLLYMPENPWRGLVALVAAVGFAVTLLLDRLAARARSAR